MTILVHSPAIILTTVALYSDRFMNWMVVKQGNIWDCRSLGHHKAGYVFLDGEERREKLCKKEFYDKIKIIVICAFQHLAKLACCGRLFISS
jgi:hypothetical protein